MSCVGTDANVSGRKKKEKMQGSHVIKLKLSKLLFYSMMKSGKMLNWTIKSVQAHIPGRLL